MSGLLTSQPSAILQRASEAQAWPSELDHVAIWRAPDHLTIAIYTRSSGMSHMKEFVEVPDDIAQFAQQLRRWLRGIALFDGDEDAARVAAAIAVRAAVH